MKGDFNNRHLMHKVRLLENKVERLSFVVICLAVTVVIAILMYFFTK